MKPQFDRYVEDYDLLLDDALSVSGETKDYFARARIASLGRLLEHSNTKIQSVLDFGCATGSASPHFFEYLCAKNVLGVDLSARMIEAARQAHGSERAVFAPLNEYEPHGDVDLVFCNGVFHHIPAAERPGALSTIMRSLRPGGILSFWENNPWNPGARYVMKKCDFDKTAEKISSPKAKRLLANAGFRVISLTYHFVFPRQLRPLRALEPLLRKIPVGAQYHVLSRKTD